MNIDSLGADRVDWISGMTAQEMIERDRQSDSEYFSPWVSWFAVVVVILMAWFGVDDLIKDLIHHAKARFHRHR